MIGHEIADVPRIIHQTWKHRHPGGLLRQCADSFRKWNPNWEYRLWSDLECEEFMQSRFPNFFHTYMAFPAGEFRADLFRMAALSYFGGVYADMEMICLRPLDELIASIDGDWEVALARDHPIHERRFWDRRAMWMNAFMIAKPGSYLMAELMKQARRNLLSGLIQNDSLNSPVRLTGAGLLSTVVDHSPTGAAGLQIHCIDWRRIYPLPNVCAGFPERRAYERLIQERTWMEGKQISSPEESFVDSSTFQAPFTARVWRQTNTPHDKETNMLRQHGELLIQADNELVETRLQQWVHDFGESLDAAGYGLTLSSEWKGRCEWVIIGEPVIKTDGKQLPFFTLARQALAGLGATVRRDGIASHPEKDHGRTDQKRCVSVAISSECPPGEAALALNRLLKPNPDCPVTAVLILGNPTETSSGTLQFLKRFGYALVTETGGWLLQSPNDFKLSIPTLIHSFRANTFLLEPRAAWIERSWLRVHRSNQWTVKKWTPENIQLFLEEHFPWFLDTYSEYRDERTRWGAARFLILRTFGGIAVTPGLISLRPLTPVLSGKSFLAASNQARHSNSSAPVSISDTVIASVPDHPIWNAVEYDLERSAGHPYESAVGAEFLQRRMYESMRFIAAGMEPRIALPEVFDPPLSPETDPDAFLSEEGLKAITAEHPNAMAFNPANRKKRSR